MNQKQAINPIKSENSYEGKYMKHTIADKKLYQAITLNHLGHGSGDRMQYDLQ